MTSAEAAALRDLVLSGKVASASLDPRKLASAYVAIRASTSDQFPGDNLAASAFAESWRAASFRRARRDT